MDVAVCDIEDLYVKYKWEFTSGVDSVIVEGLTPRCAIDNGTWLRVALR